MRVLVNMTAAARVLRFCVHWITAGVTVCSHIFRGKRVLELGSGVGLAGIVAAHYGGATVLSDYPVDVVHNLRYNVDVNRELVNRYRGRELGDAAVVAGKLDWADFSVDGTCGALGLGVRDAGDGGGAAGVAAGGDVGAGAAGSGAAAGGGGSGGGGGAVVTAEMPRDDSGTNDEVVDADIAREVRHKFDIVIGSDIVYKKADVTMICNVLRGVMSPHGTLYMASAPARSRYGVEHIAPVLQGAMHCLLSLSLSLSLSLLWCASACICVLVRARTWACV